MNGTTENFANPGILWDIEWHINDTTTIKAKICPGFLNENPITQLASNPLPIIIFNAWNPNSIKQAQGKEIIESKRFVYFVVYNDKIQEIFINAIKFEQIARAYPDTSLDVCFRVSDESEESQPLKTVDYEPKIQFLPDSEYKKIISTQFFRDAAPVSKRHSNEKTPLNKKEARECCSVQ